MLRFDANLRWLFTEVPMADRYRAAAEAGFRGVEVAFPYDVPATETAQQLVDHDLSLVQILTPMDWAGGERGLAALPDRVSDFRDSVKIALDYALEVGRPFIHPLAGNVPTGADRAPYFDTFVENLDFAAALCVQEGITVIIEPVCRARFPDTFVNCSCARTARPTRLRVRPDSPRRPGRGRFRSAPSTCCCRFSAQPRRPSCFPSASPREDSSSR